VPFSRFYGHDEQAVRRRDRRMNLAERLSSRAENPVDIIEQIAAHSAWVFEREEEDEISIAVSGQWSDYQLSFTWLPGVEALHLVCAFDLTVPERRQAEVSALISALNSRLWVGHFDLWKGGRAIMFRHSLLLTGGITPSQEQCAALMKIALEECERAFQCFQFVVWAGKSATEAMDSLMFETVGEA
jgi:hypothetical protein